MPGPKPHGRFAPNGQPSQLDAATAEAWSKRLQALKSAYGLDSLQIVRDLPGGARVIAFDMGGLRKTIVLQPERIAHEDPDQPKIPAVSSLPMLFSGVVTKPIASANPESPTTNVEVLLSDGTLRRLRGYSNDADWSPLKRIRMERFTIPYGPSFQSLAPLRPSEALIFTQYHGQLPTWYSGAMRQVVQVVAGYGLQTAGQTLKDVESPQYRMETARMILPVEVADEIEKELGANFLLPGYTGEPPESGEIQFDFQFQKSNVVSFDGGGKPWLIEISSRGVWAMPLPMIPATTTDAFRKYIEDVGDQEIIEILDVFGGMPSGEGFPTKLREEWRKAGVVIEVCDDGGFYGEQGVPHFPYFTACGWSVNTRGTEGYNTCFSGDWSSGKLTGYAYKLSLRMQRNTFDGKLPEFFERLDEDGALTRYLQAVYQALRGDERGDVIRYKIRRMSESDLRSRIRGFDPANAAGEVTYISNLTQPPIAAHTGSIRQTAKNGIATSSIKFPEPILDGNIDYDPAVALGETRPSSPKRPFDSILFGYYAGDSLKVLRQAQDDREFFREGESDFEGCTAVGAWEITSYTGRQGIAGGYYSSDFDYRQELGGTRSKTKIRGHDLGWDQHLRYISSGNPVLVRPGNGVLFAVRWYHHETDTETVAGESLFLGGAVPYFMRDALVFANSKWGGTKTVSHSIGGPDYKYGPQIEVNYDVVWTPNGWMTAGVGVGTADGQRYGYTYRTGKDVHGSEDIGCGFATTGPVLPPPNRDITDLIMALPLPAASDGWAFQYWYTEEKKGGSVPYVHTESTTTVTPGKPEGVGEIEVSYEGGVRRLSKDLNVQGFGIESPDPETGMATFLAEATMNVIGNTAYFAINPGVGPLRRVGHSALVADRPIPFFIGVINE